MLNLTTIRETALFNAVILFKFWKLDYQQINNDEYDFLNPLRKDKNFGACRFNIKKGVGADFTGYAFSSEDYSQIGQGFNKEDFSSTKDQKYANFGFDIIGLCQRLHKCASYTEAAKLLSFQLQELSKKELVVVPRIDSADKRVESKKLEADKKLKIARKTWEICSPIKNTLGDTYLKSRKIYLKENQENIRYHSKILNMELKKTIPALLFKVQKSPDGSLQAIHRIYLRPDGQGKADVKMPKMALCNIKGCGIWFGEKNKVLCIVEGPENALSILSLGYDFVVSTIDASNFSNLTIPECVRKIVLMPDGDKAGVESAKKAKEEYEKLKIPVSVVFPPKKKDYPKWDWNDELVFRGSYGKEER